MYLLYNMNKEHTNVAYGLCFSVLKEEYKVAFKFTLWSGCYFMYSRLFSVHWRNWLHCHTDRVTLPTIIAPLPQLIHTLSHLMIIWGSSTVVECIFWNMSGWWGHKAASIFWQVYLRETTTLNFEIWRASDAHAQLCVQETVDCAGNTPVRRPACGRHTKGNRWFLSKNIFFFFR